MKVTFRVTDGVFGRGGFSSQAEAVEWLAKHGLRWANLYVDVSVKQDNSTLVTETFITRLEKGDFETEEII